MRAVLWRWILGGAGGGGGIEHRAAPISHAPSAAENFGRTNRAKNICGTGTALRGGYVEF